MYKLSRYAMTIVLSVLAGILVCSIVYARHFPGNLSMVSAPTAKKSETFDSDGRGLFGYNLATDFNAQQCTHQPLQLNGVIVHNQEYLFNIVGNSPQRLYKSTERIDGKFPIVAYSSNRVLLRVTGEDVLLCNNSPAKTTAMETNKSRVNQDITTHYFTLSAQEDHAKNITGYAIGNCTSQCKLALKMVGLKVTDVITAINDTPFTGPDVLQEVNSKLPTLESIRLSVLRHGKNEVVTINNINYFRRLFPSANLSTTPA